VSPQMMEATSRRSKQSHEGASGAPSPDTSPTSVSVPVVVDRTFGKLDREGSPTSVFEYLGLPPPLVPAKMTAAAAVSATGATTSRTASAPASGAPPAQAASGTPPAPVSGAPPAPTSGTLPQQYVLTISRQRQRAGSATSGYDPREAAYERANRRNALLRHRSGMQTMRVCSSVVSTNRSLTESRMSCGSLEGGARRVRVPAERFVQTVPAALPTPHDRQAIACAYRASHYAAKTAWKN